MLVAPLFTSWTLGRNHHFSSTGSHTEKNLIRFCILQYLNADNYSSCFSAAYCADHFLSDLLYMIQGVRQGSKEGSKSLFSIRMPCVSSSGCV